MLFISVVSTCFQIVAKYKSVLSYYVRVLIGRTANDCLCKLRFCFSFSYCVFMCYSHNGGVCVQQEGGYVCICGSRYTGKNCEVDFLTDLCRSGLCKSESHCVNTKGVRTDKQEVMAGFQCLNCTLADWSTPLCELRARSFNRGSYLTFSALKQRYRLTISLRFATKEMNGLLFYNGRYNEQHDFVALEIIDSRLVFSFSLGAGVSKVSVALPEGHINDGKWHHVEVKYLNRTAIIKVDGCDEGLIAAVLRGQLEENYACANKTTLHLEARCADKMQTCYRFLDLTGPLQIGGLPTLPTRFQVETKDFVGCITDLYVDHQLVDLNSYVANNGTAAGCSAKRGFCHSHPCRNGGTCEEVWGSYFCQCPDGFGGHDCSEVHEVVKQFKGDGFHKFTPRLKPLSLPWAVKLSFRTFAPKGLLMQIKLGQDSVVVIDMVDGYVRYSYNYQTLAMRHIKVDDGKWHHFEANWMTNGIWLNLDYGQFEDNKDLVGDIRGMYVAEVSIGGLEKTDGFDDSPYYQNFVGCIKEVDIGESKDSWLYHAKEENVYDGCSTINPCLSNPCPIDSKCINKGLLQYECKCDVGFAGAQCLPICELNPCHPKSTCVSGNTTLGYKCNCDRQHTGTYCEVKLQETCPSSWWGHPFCGPCNCDTSKGYDGNCNKTSGACSCEANHFQPPNSDVCFDCDCYAIGSYSNRCDSVTGQCRCRQGVIGRRCDSCPSPFAEVTLKGCEVIYDGCPRSFSGGIWWDRSLFDTDAVQSCPTGSFGKAMRRCSEANGWQQPDLFECTSNTFGELADQLLFLEKDKFPLTTYLSIKIANDLRVALNSTYPLYGNDIFIARRLIQYLIEHELTQAGLNLTHKQDRYFLSNLIEVTSKLLEPRYATQWDRIGALSDTNGPEHLLTLFNNYAETLITNQQDTFTEPFEISEKYMIFGLDSVSSGELWDLPKSLQTYTNRSLLAKSSIPSIYVDFSLPNDGGAAVSIPKYNNYPTRKQNIDDITRAVIPLKAVGVKSINEISESPYSTSFATSFQKPAKALIGYAIFPSLGQLLPNIFDKSLR